MIVKLFRLFRFELRRKWLFMSMLPLFCFTANAQSLKIHVTTAGTLSEKIGENRKNSIISLSVSGMLNSDDLRFLREMAGVTASGKPTIGKLTQLNLQKARFVSGGEAYFTKGNRSFFAKTGTAVPSYLFAYTHLESFVFPSKTDTIDSYAFSHCGLKQLKLPENVMLNNGAFSNDSLLTTVTFPKNTRSFSKGVFDDCPLVTQLQLNNVNYFSGKSISNMNGLKNITFNGTLQHIEDSMTVSNCLKLKNIDFRGPVYSTGSPKFVTNCPELEYITFYGPVLETRFDKPDNCPEFKGYVIKNVLCYSQSLPTSTLEQLNKSKVFHQMITQIQNQCQLLAKQYKKNKKDIAALSGNIYDVACRYALDNDKDNALKYLEMAIRSGFEDYETMKSDKDLIHIRGEKKYDELFEQVRQKGSKLCILQHSAPYMGTSGRRAGITFTYEPATDRALVAIRKYFKLDSVAGNGPELSKIIKVLYFLHDSIRHDGSSSWPTCRFNAIDLYKVTRAEKRGLNCRFMAMMLNDMYLSLGIKSRFVTCQPRDYDTDEDCHVTNMVWCHTLHKWIWIDPTMCAVVMDEKGQFLNQGEVRQRLIQEKPLMINEDANWNHQQRQTVDDYLNYYMAKNLYLLSVHERSECESEAKNGNMKSRSVTLVPKGFNFSYGDIITEDENEFWQAPEGE